MLHILIEDCTRLVNPVWSSQKSQVYSYGRKKSEIPRKRFFTEHQDHPARVKISVGVSKFSTIPIYFVKPRVTINQHY